MLKLLISVLLVCFAICCFAIILYWQDIQHDPTNFELIGGLIFLPMMLAATICSPFIAYKSFKYYKKKKASDKLDLEQEQAEKPFIEKQSIEHYELQLFSASALHAFGEGKDIIQAIMDFKSPELDIELKNQISLPILSYRIESIDSTLKDEEDRPSKRQQRIKALIEQQLEQHAESLLHISEHLRHSALYYETEIAYEYRIHPAWNNENYIDDEQLNEIRAITRLHRLNLFVCLAENLLHTWTDEYRDELIQYLARNYSIFSQQIHIEWSFLNPSTSTEYFHTLLKEKVQAEGEVSLIICVDSELDQEWYDERVWNNDHYIPAEYAASWCFTSLETVVNDLFALKKICIADHVENLGEYLQSNENLQKISIGDAEDPFVMVLDLPTNKILKKLQSQFENSKMEAEHCVFGQTLLGNTEQVAKLFLGLVSVYLDDNVMTLVASTQHDKQYIWITEPQIVEESKQLKVA